MVTTRDTSGTLCEEAMRAFDRLCALERTRDDAEAMLTPRQAHRRRLLEARASAAEWIVPPEIAATVHALIDAADRIDDPALAFVWTDHLPVAVLVVPRAPEPRPPPRGRRPVRLRRCLNEPRHCRRPGAHGPGRPDAHREVAKRWYRRWNSNPHEVALNGV